MHACWFDATAICRRWYQHDSCHELDIRGDMVAVVQTPGTWSFWSFWSFWCLLMSVLRSPAQHYRPQMFLDNLTSSMQSTASASTSSALVSSSSSSHYEASAHTATSIHETRVITGGGGGAVGGTDSSISDIISLDWVTIHWTFSGLFSVAFFFWTSCRCNDGIDTQSPPHMDPRGHVGGRNIPSITTGSFGCGGSCCSVLFANGVFILSANMGGRMASWPRTK